MEGKSKANNRYVWVVLKGKNLYDYGNNKLHRTASRANLKAHNQEDEAVGGIVLDLLAVEDDDDDADDDDGAFLVVVLSVLVAE